MACNIDKNSTNFKRLVLQVGEYKAIGTLISKGNDVYIPNIKELKSELSFPTNPTERGVHIFEKRLKRYNNHNKTSHSFIKTQKQGHLETYNLKLIPSYVTKKVLKELRKQIGEAQDFLHGVDTIIPEDLITAFKHNEYYVENELHPTYEDALNAAKKSIEESNKLLNSEINKDLEIREKLENLEIDNNVINYLYKDSSKRLSKEQYSIEVNKIVNGMENSFDTSEILETIKCL